MIKAKKNKVKFSGSVEVVAAEMIAILHEFVVWEALNSLKPAVELKKDANELYTAWKNREEN